MAIDLNSGFRTVMRGLRQTSTWKKSADIAKSLAVARGVATTDMSARSAFKQLAFDSLKRNAPNIGVYAGIGAGIGGYRSYRDGGSFMGGAVRGAFQGAAFGGGLAAARGVASLRGTGLWSAMRNDYRNARAAWAARGSRGAIRRGALPARSQLALPGSSAIPMPATMNGAIVPYVIPMGPGQ